jgi:hypothetical protein
VLRAAVTSGVESCTQAAKHCDVMSRFKALGVLRRPERIIALILEHEIGN